MKLFSYLISLLTPLALIGLALRILLTPLFYTIEYNMPYFPVDEYGFTKADRLKWAPYAVDYLVNDADISYLGDLQFDADQNPMIFFCRHTARRHVTTITNERRCRGAG